MIAPPSPWFDRGGKSRADPRAAHDHVCQRDAASDFATARGAPDLQLQRVLGNDGYGRVVQPKLIVGSPDDPSEREADRVADELVSTPDFGPLPALAEPTFAPPPRRVDRKCEDCEAEDEEVQTKPLVANGKATHRLNEEAVRALHGRGEPLEASEQAFFGSRFGVDFGSVRIHVGGHAAELARSLHARAFATGSDVVFGAGEYAPGTTEGRRLMAHELTHVVQQGASRGPDVIRRQVSTPATGEPVRFSFSVRVSSILDSDQLLIEFVKQYRGLSSDEEAQAVRDREHWQWEGRPPTVTDDQVRRGFILLPVVDWSIRSGTLGERQGRRRYFGSLAPEQQAAMTAEVDRAFWERTHYRVGQKLGTSRQDAAMAQYWLVLRDELVRRRQQIDALPTHIRSFLFSEDSSRVLEPRDYAAVLRIAAKLIALSPDELSEYSARTTAQTTDWASLEMALDRFTAERRERAQAVQLRETTKQRLYRLDDVYQQYRDYLSLLKTSAFLAGAGAQNPQAVGTSLGTQPTLNRMLAELTASLQRYGFSGVDEFEQAIRAFATAFRDEAVHIGDEMLDRYEHILYQQEQRYQNTAETAALYRQLEPARQHFQEANRIREEHAMMPWTPEEMAEQSYWVGQRQRALAQGEATVTGLSAAHPLMANPDLPREELALASEGGVRTVMLEYIRDRRRDVQTTRQNLANHPDLVFELDSLLQLAFQEEDIRPGSIYHHIVQDHIRDTQIERTIVNLAIAVFAIAAGLVSGGTGTVAVLGAATALGISAFQAVEEFRRYETMSAAHGAQLLSEDPSIAWVVVAVVGAGVDAAGFVSALRRTPELVGAIRAFNQTGDVAALEGRLARLTGVEERIRRNVLRAAEAEAQARAAWRSVFRPPTALRAVIVPGAEEFARLVYAVYLSVRRGIINLERFVLTREAIDLIGDVARLSPEELTLLKTAYTQAVRDAQTIASHGAALGMREDEIHAFIRMWGNSRGHTVEEIMQQMGEWAEPLRTRAGARYRMAPDLIMDAETRRLLPDFERRIAGTGGIERITASRTAEGGLSVTIEGEVLPGMTRRPRAAAPGEPVAPSFNVSEANLATRRELGLGADWERLHLWGPGFGDEAAAGMMMGPRSVNHVWQNRSVEDYIRLLGEQARREGGRVRVRATAVAWERPTPRGWNPPMGENFLKDVEYRITLELPGKPPQPIRVTLEVSEPPAATIRRFRIDPEGAINPADLFPVTRVNRSLGNQALQPNDLDELEADRVAELESGVDHVLASPGTPLDPALRQDMERRFGHDFSRVRVHTGASADQSARDVTAHAYTVGDDIVFDTARFAPGTIEGRRLIAHELTHVIQQGETGANANSGHAIIQRRPARKGSGTKKRTIITIHAQPLKLGDATAYLAGETGALTITLTKNQMTEGSYTYVQRDNPSTPQLEYVLENGGGGGFHIQRPADKSIAFAERLRIEVQQGEFDFDAYAKAEFEAVPDRIKNRITKRGAPPLRTADDYLGFASFAKELERRGVTDEELTLFQERNRGGVSSRYRIDWALDWQRAAEEVLGARAALEKKAEQNRELFRGFGSAIPNVPNKTYELYRMSQWLPELRPLVKEKIGDTGTSLEVLEANRDWMMEEFDTRLRLETNVALDRLEGGLLLTRERLVRDKGALQKIGAMRAAARSNEVLALKARKEQLGHEKDSARDAYAATLIEHQRWPGAQAVKDAERTLESAGAAYDEAKQNYLNGLEDVSGVPVASWRGFNVDEFFYATSSDRSRDVLEGFIAQTLRDLTRARRELGKDMRTIYKADMMIRRTKNVLGVVSGSTVDKLIDDRVEEYKTAPWWERLLDILSIALIFVPGGVAITAIRVGVGLAQTFTTIEHEALAETLSRAEVKQEGGSVTTVAMSALGNVADVGDIAKVLKGGSTVLETASKVEKTAAKGASDLPAPHLPPDAPVSSTALPHAPEPPIRTDVLEAPSTHPPSALPPPAPPSILDVKPTTPEEAFGSLKQELKDVPEAVGPVTGQRLGASAPGPVQAPKPRRRPSAAERSASAQHERQIAADKRKEVLDDMNLRAPDVHKDVVTPGERLQNNQSLADFAVNNPDRVELLHAEWVDGVAKGNIKKSTSFSAYVKRRVAGDRGLAGELEDAFVRGPDEILVKAPKKKSNLRGTDSMSYRVREDRIRYLDNKSVTTGASVGKVSAIEKNLIENMSDDIADIERSIRLPDVPPEIEQIVLPRLKSAREELKQYVRAQQLRPEDLYSPAVRDAFDSILRNNGIDRVVTFGGAGQGARISTPLSGAAGFGTERP